MLIWEWNWSPLCLCLEKAWGKIGTVWKQTAVTDLGDDRKQAVWRWIGSYYFIWLDFHSAAVLEDERLEGEKRDGYNRRQQVFHTLQQIDKSFQRPQKLCCFNQITGQNSECLLSRNVPIQKFGCTIIVSTRRWVDIMFCLSSLFVHFFSFHLYNIFVLVFTCICMPWRPRH